MHDLVQNLREASAQVSRQPHTDNCCIMGIGRHLRADSVVRLYNLSTGSSKHNTTNFGKSTYILHTIVEGQDFLGSGSYLGNSLFPIGDVVPPVQFRYAIEPVAVLGISLLDHICPVPQKI